jgi:hypothetical protein
VVDTTGTGSLNFNELTGTQFLVAVRHRNHLAVVTANPVTLGAAAGVADFTGGANVHGTNPQVVIGGKHAMWAGNTGGDTKVIQAGPGNDVNPVLIKVLGNPQNTSLNANFIVAGYAVTDANMDGRTIAAGPSNDVNTIVANVFIHPGNTTLAGNYIINEQMK